MHIRMVYVYVHVCVWLWSCIAVSLLAAGRYATP